MLSLAPLKIAVACNGAFPAWPFSVLMSWVSVWHAGNKVARRLSEEGCQVAAWNRNPSKAAALSEAGISVHESAQDAVQDSDILILLLSDADAIKDVLLNTDQPVMLQDKVVVQMGTIGCFTNAHTWTLIACSVPATLFAKTFPSHYSYLAACN